MSSRPLIPVLLGLTATGKTDAGIELSKLVDGEVISVDSRKVYEGLPIGTATPEGHWKEGAYVVENVPHHLMGHLRPDQPYTAGDFAPDAGKIIDAILQKGRVPVLVGGTGFYFKALQQGLPDVPPRDEAVRGKLMEETTGIGLPALHARLKEHDPIAAGRIKIGDTHKIVRALEVITLTGEPFSSWKDKGRQPSPHKFLVVALNMDKDSLERRIEERSKRMFKDGMIEETEAVLQKGYSPTCPALASFGYREAVHVIQGRLPRKEFLPLLIKGTKAYAKRQRTWFRTQTKPLWIDCRPETTAAEISLKMKALLYSAA
jgi:tRNA dimethylallyltransferase